MTNGEAGVSGRLDAISGSLEAIRKALVRVLRAGQVKGGARDSRQNAIAADRGSSEGGAEGWLRWIEENAERRRREEAQEEREEDDEKLMVAAIVRDQRERADMLQRQQIRQAVERSLWHHALAARKLVTAAAAPVSPSTVRYVWPVSRASGVEQRWLGIESVKSGRGQKREAEGRDGQNEGSGALMRGEELLS